jgi:hypothetical protein
VNLDDAMSAAAEKLSGATESDPVIEPAPEAAPATETPAPESASAAAQRARDEAGRFAKAAEKAAAQKPPAAPKGDVHGAAQAAPPAGPGKAEGAASLPAPSAEPVKPAEPPVKLPSSWKPAAREALAKAPREVQEEALRIDHEVRKVMQEAAPLKQRMAEIERTLQPFEGLARANGMDATAYAGSVLQTAAQLFQGPVQARRAIVAQLIQQAGLAGDEDLAAISQHLANPQAAFRQQPPQQQAPDVRSEIQRVIEEERTQAALQAFQATNPEFLDDVWPDMVAVIEADKRAGRNPDLKRAYDRACRMNEDVAKILEQRKAVETTRTATAATQAAKAAAVSIKSQPAAPVRAKPKGLDGAMAAAREKLGM